MPIDQVQDTDVQASQHTDHIAVESDHEQDNPDAYASDSTASDLEKTMTGQELGKKMFRYLRKLLKSRF